MVDKKITELPSVTGANLADTDVFPVVDVSANTTAKITRAEFFKNTPSIGIGTSSPSSIVGGTDTSPVLSIGGTDTALVVGDKSGSLSFITNDASYTATYADGVTGEIASISDSATGAAYGLALYTGTTTGSNRAERMRITSTGNVGIGTSSPVAALSVQGDILAPSPTAGLSSFTIGVQNAPTNVFSNQKRGSLVIQASSAVGTTNSMGGGDLTLRAGDSYTAANNIHGDVLIIAGRNLAGSSAGAGNVTFTTNNTERMRITSTGNVGIGTNTPSSKLHVKEVQDSAAELRVEAGTTATATALDATLRLIARSTNNATADAYVKAIGTGGEASFLTFGTENAGSLGEHMRITNTGSVGIGTSSPAVKLDISNGATAGTALQVATTGAGNNIDMVDATGTARFRNVSGEMRLYGDLNTGGNGNIIFHPQGATERMRINSAGNVGIGTTSPNAASIIDAQSTTKGVRFPNMTTTQKNAIANVAGNVIFDTTLGKLCVNTGSGWQTITSV